MPAQSSFAGSTILIVEDEYLIADDLARDFAGQGATVIGPFATLDDALERLDEHRPDMAVLDINLRGDAVFPLADALSARNIPFVFATGYDAGSIPDRFVRVPRCEKPVRSRALLGALEVERNARA
ncbi:MAG TPA: response regulator [Sphingomonas sp.]|nr:response regulator [Sphingomonas sp.]